MTRIQTWVSINMFFYLNMLLLFALGTDMSVIDWSWLGTVLVGVTLGLSVHYISNKVAGHAT